MERQPEAEKASVGVMVKRNCSNALWESEFCENRIFKRILWNQDFFLRLNVA